MYDDEEFEEEDTEILKDMKRISSKKKKSFSAIINSKELSEDEMDDLFLAGEA